MGNVSTILCYQKHAKGVKHGQIGQITLKTIVGWQTMTVISKIKGHQALWRVKEKLKCFVAQDKNTMCYKWYIGDGDSSSFSDVVNAKPYGGTVGIQKRECIGHVQKRVGTRCRNQRQTLKSTVLSGGKKFLLTEKAINTLQKKG